MGVSKLFKPNKKTVELKPPARVSRIRRDPALADTSIARDAWWDSREWEIRLAIVGITMFALGLSALVFDIGEVLGH